MRLLSSLSFLFISASLAAQPAAIFGITKACSTPDLKKNLYYLASPTMDGRMMGSRGDSLASVYIADWFRQSGLKAPYANGKSYRQMVPATRQQRVASLQIGERRFDYLDGWQLFPPSSLQLNNVPVVFAADSTMEAVLQALATTDLTGKAVGVTGQAAVTAFASNIDSVEGVLKDRGAVAVVWYHPRVAGRLQSQKDRTFLPNYKLPPALAPNEAFAVLPEVAMVPERMANLVAGDGIVIDANGSISANAPAAPLLLKNRLSLSFAIEEEAAPPVMAPNIIGVLPGTDPSAPAVVVSAHHDHDGKKGSDTYYGAVDNASGTAAIMQLAKMMRQAAAKGLKPKRSIVFASFTGEERGLLGSFYYVDHPVYPPEKTYAVMNLDMLGRVDTLYSGRKADSSYAYYLVSDSLNRGLNEALLKANQTVGLTLDPLFTKGGYRQRALQGSDQYPFYLKKIPFLFIHCGFPAEYHQPTDTPDKINYPLLTKQVQLAFLTLWNTAND